MDKFFYLIAQLPMLSFEGGLPVTVEEYLDEARKWLRPADYRILAGVDIFDTSTGKRDAPAIVREYRAFERAFRSDLAGWRQALRTGEDYVPSTFPPALVRGANPLENERNLLEHRWQFLDEREANHHFDLEFLILYHLKLQILSRLDSFDAERGRQVFKEVSGIRE
jgi:hypothetical protein